MTENMMVNDEMSMDELNDVAGGCLAYKLFGKCSRIGYFHGCNDAKDGTPRADYLNGQSDGLFYNLGYTLTKSKH